MCFPFSKHMVSGIFINQRFERMHKGDILAAYAAGRTFQAAAGRTDFAGGMSCQKQCVDIFIGIESSVLVENMGTTCQTQGGQAVVLSDRDIRAESDWQS